MQTYEKTGELIASARREKSLTQKQLASLLHISDTTVSKWERGKGFPDVSLVEPLCNALSLSVAALFGGEQQEVPPSAAVEALAANMLEETLAQRRAHQRQQRTVFLVALAVVLLIALPLLFLRAEAPPSLVGTYQYQPEEGSVPFLFLSLAVDWPDEDGCGTYSLYADSRLVEEGTYITNADGTFTLFGFYSDGTPRMFLLTPDKNGSIRLLLSGCADHPFLLDKLADIPGYIGYTYGDEEEYRIKLLPPLS
ncbi:MAG: helix-turn-helix transcriptional regulator [Clostridiales bacterium]|nr:helix-turn-helix transcriptional regulator [Clostridiales bacterium]